MLGQGIYTLAEVARLTELNPSRVRSWFKQRLDGSGPGPLMRGDYEAVEGDFAISFLDLIDVLMAGQFRNHGVSMHVVRKAYNALSLELKTAHPFCHKGLLTDGKKIFYHTSETVGDEKLREVVSSQLFFTHIKEHLNQVEYDSLTSLINRWHIANGITVDPAISMGKPTIEGTGITTYVINAQYHANKQNGSLIADLYDITEKDVDHAVAFEAGLAA